MLSRGSSHSYSFKGHSLTSPGTVSSVIVAQMCYRNITIFTHRTIPALQRLRVWLNFSLFKCDSFFHKNLHFVVKPTEKTVKTETNTYYFYYSASWQCTLAKSLNIFVQLVWNKVRGSHVPSCTQRHQGISYMRTNKHAAGDNKDVRKDKVVPLTSGSYYICQSHI